MENRNAEERKSKEIGNDKDKAKKTQKNKTELRDKRENKEEFQHEQQSMSHNINALKRLEI